MKTNRRKSGRWIFISTLLWASFSIPIASFGQGGVQSSSDSVLVPPVRARSYVLNTRAGDKEVVEVPGGSFLMSDRQFEVGLSGFGVSRDLVTVGEMVKFLNDTDADYETAFIGYDRFDLIRYEDGRYVHDEVKRDWPVPNITWKTATAYCQWLSDDEHTIRLPTEAEWEYLASNGGITKYPWSKRKQWREPIPFHPTEVRGTFLGYLPVGSQPLNANKWGVRDLIGSRPQWCSDLYGSYPKSLGPLLNPKGPSEEDEYRRLGGELEYIYRGGVFAMISYKESLPTATDRNRRIGTHGGIYDAWHTMGLRWVFDTDEPTKDSP